MYSQSGGMGQSGMPMQGQPQQNQVVSSASMQIQQSNMMTMQNQQSVPSMPQQMNPNIGGMVQQHTVGGPVQPQQITGIRQPHMGFVNQQGLHIKQEIGSTGMPEVAMARQRMPMQSQVVQSQAPTQEPSATSQTNPLDPIVRFKLLLPQLKESLVTLISVARQNFVGNATNDNSEKTVDTSQFPRFDKALEHFYSICNQIEVNLCLASDQISQTLSSIQHTPLLSTAKDMQLYPNYIMTVKQQLEYAKEIQNMLIEASTKNSPHPTASGMMLRQ